MGEYRKHYSNSVELANWYNAKYTEMGDGWNTPAEVSNAHLDDLGVPLDHTKTLLDVGCGAGHFIAEAERRVTCYGMEVSAKAVDYSRKRCGSKIYHYSIETPWDHSYDYVVSIGSLEHVVDLDAALDNIRNILKPDGKFYFFCPNEKWEHFDQPNERTMADSEWIELFRKHGLYVHTTRRWNDSTAFTGMTRDADIYHMPPKGENLNIGSGQRRFDNANGWINVDKVSRPPDQVPDLVCDVGRDPLPYADGSISRVVLHQVYEHFGLAEGHGVLREIHRTLKPGGSLIITVPDMRALAQRWIMKEIDDYIYFVNMYGAYQGEDGDRHRWGYTIGSLRKDLSSLGIWSKILPFDWRDIPGASIAKDWWIIGIEVTK